MKLSLKSIAALALVAALSASTAPTWAGSCSSAKASRGDIVTTAVEAGTFNTLVAAVKAAGLVDALKGDGPLTVFAPTDEAFAKLPKGTIEQLLRPENKDQLVSILTYHVAPGKLTADKVVELDRVKTLNGQRPRVVTDQNSVMVGGATVTATDILTSNGVIHVIDTVLLPETPRISQAGPATDLIELAIDRGVPLFNEGQTKACAAIYEVAVNGLLSSDSMGLSSANQASLEHALAALKRTHDPRRQAWILRDALDEVRKDLRSQTPMGDMAMGRH